VCFSGSPGQPCRPRTALKRPHGNGTQREMPETSGAVAAA